MKRLTDALRRRLKNRRGETITEVLVALLISALALTMLAAMIASASKMVEQSRDRLDGYYKAENDLADPSGAALGQGQVVLQGEGSSDSWSVDYYTDGDSLVAYRPR